MQGLYEKRHAKISLISSLQHHLTSMMDDCGDYVGYWFGGAYVLRNELSPTDLIGFVDDSRSLCNQGQRTYRAVRRLIKQVQSMRELARFYSTPTAIGLDGGWSPASAEEAAAVRWDVEFKDCHFAYPSDPKVRILAGFSCKIEAGQLVGLCGQTHCGKSTVLRLVERLYDVSDGEILIGGRSKIPP